MEPDILNPSAFANERKQMVEQQLRRRNILEARVLQAMSNVPRHMFVPENMQNMAYSDQPLGIGQGQTISQPYMVACMTECLQLADTDRVLEIGTGSGYQTAVLVCIAKEVYTVERVRQLHEKARENLKNAGFVDNVHFKCGDGSLGWLQHAPFDAIIVTAGSPKTPESLKQQLADGGRLVVPVGSRFHQDLHITTRVGDKFETTHDIGCVFVPLIGEEGW